jgi:MOSC domain-containing protein YiiM
LVGREFRVGGVLMLGTELCNPCARPSNLARTAVREGREGFLSAFENRGGLRAAILEGGEIVVGAPIEIFTNQ